MRNPVNYIPMGYYRIGVYKECHCDNKGGCYVPFEVPRKQQFVLNASGPKPPQRPHTVGQHGSVSLQKQQKALGCDQCVKACSARGCRDARVYAVREFGEPAEKALG